MPDADAGVGGELAMLEEDSPVQFRMSPVERLTKLKDSLTIQQE